MPFYPVNLNIANQACIVVGGGSVAERKVGALLAAGALVTVLSPEMTLGLQALLEEERIIHIARNYQSGDITGFFIVISATNHSAVNKMIADEARIVGALINVVDAPELGNFSVPAQISRGDLLLTISTGGKSPALAKRLGAELATQYGPEYGIYIELLAKARQTMKAVMRSSKEREAFWRQTIDHEIIDLLKDGKLKEAEAKINNAIGCSGTQS